MRVAEGCGRVITGSLNRTSTTGRKSSENITLCFCNHSSIIPSHMLAKCVLPGIKLEQALQRQENKIEHHMLTSSTQLRNRSFHFAERTRASVKCPKMGNACAKRAKLLFFIVKYANCLLYTSPSPRDLSTSRMPSSA